MKIVPLSELSADEIEQLLGEGVPTQHENHAELLH
jgi:hypothetical protein